MVTYEKVTLGRALARLSPKDLYNALQIVVQNHPDFQLTTEEVHLDMDYLVITCLSKLLELQYYISIYVIFAIDWT